MKKILVPYDFSEQSSSAFRLAADIAKNSKGELHLLHVVELPVLHDTVLMPVLSFEEALLKELREAATKKFEKLIAKYGGELKKIITKVEFGATHRMLLDYAEEQEIDLIIMGTKGASGLKEMTIGSNTEKIVRRSPVPVISVKGTVKGDAIKSIVFPNTLDTENQEDLVMKVKALQNFFKATLHIVWVNTPLNFTPDTETYARLKAFAKRFMLKDFTINVFNYSNEEAGILHFTEQIKGNLIAMGTHGRRGIAHVLSGSLAEDVVNHVGFPVWTYTIKED